MAWLTAPAAFAISLVESNRRGALPMPSRTEMILAVAATLAVWTLVSYVTLLIVALVRDASRTK